MLDNKYLLSLMVAARANQLKKGAKPLVETKYKKPTMIAYEEIKAGKVFIKEKKEPLKSEDVFRGEEESVKKEEFINIEDLPNEVEEPIVVDDLFDEYEEPEEPEDLFDENEKPED
ncbi:MAG: DNA-directed RNA polymerase subunit omega [Atribacterota bacterium]|nr:DNA-directed RNA polymerase subunit omega [Atribacterota bacterium]